MEFDPFTGMPLKETVVRDKSFYQFEKEDDSEQLYEGKPFVHKGKPVTTAHVGRTVVDHGRDGTMLPAVMAAARQGVRNMELTPNINGRAPGQGIESINNEQRKQIKQISKLNDVNLTGVHVHPSEAGSLTGFNRQDGSFNSKFQSQQIEAIKKGIDFNADLDGGGVVFHTGEFARSDWSRLDNLGNDIEFIPQGSDDATDNFHMVDKRTGRGFVIPKDYNFIDANLNEDTFDVKTSSANWVQLKEDFDSGKYDYNDEIKKFVSEGAGVDSSSLDNFNPTFAQTVLFNLKHDEVKQIESNLEYRSAELNQLMQNQNRIDNNLDALKEYEDKMDAADLARSKKVYQGFEFMGELTQSEYMEELSKKNRGQLAQLKYQIESTSAQKERLKDDILNIADSSEFGYETSVSNLVNLAHYARKKTNESNQKGNDLSKPIYLAPENIFADDGFGAHPQEMKKWILDARQRFANDLVKAGEVKNYDDAYKQAKNHIRSTFDSSHLGMWYGNMKDKEGESTDDKISRFKKWYLDQVEDTAKEDIYGGTHIVDGFIGHTHVDIGEGMHPVKEAIKIISENTQGPLSLNSEAFENNDQVTQIWSAFNLPIRNLTADQRDFAAHRAKQTISDTAFAGMDLSGGCNNNWAAGGSWGAGMNSTNFNTKDSFPSGEKIQNWDGLPLE